MAIDFYSGLNKWLLGVFSIFELRPDSESMWKSISVEPIRLGDKAIFRPEKLTWNLDFCLFWFGQKTPWCWGVCTKDFLVLGWFWQKTPWCQPGLNQHQGVFCTNHANTKESFVQTTPAPRSLLSKPPPKTLKAISRKSKKHQGVICPNHCRDHRTQVIKMITRMHHQALK